MELKYSKVRNVKSPERGTIGSAGIDFYIPDNWNDGKEFILFQQNDILIPSGIKMDIPDGYALIAFNKSGIATKMKLDVMACVCDSDYQGEIHIHLMNNGFSATRIKPGMKIAQFLLVPIEHSSLKEVSIENLFSKETDRAESGFGSTGI